MYSTHVFPDVSLFHTYILNVPGQMGGPSAESERNQ